MPLLCGAAFKEYGDKRWTEQAFRIRYAHCMEKAFGNTGIARWVKQRKHNVEFWVEQAFQACGIKAIRLQPLR